MLHRPAHTKTSIFEIDETDQSWGIGVGIQLGPKLPTAPDTRGVGAEGLALVGLVCGPNQIAFNAGILGDPEVSGNGRPIGFETGFDVARDLDASGRWSLTGTVGAVHFFSDDPDQITFMAGIAYDPTPWLALSIMGLAGALEGGDRYGVVVGVTPKFRVWPLR